MFKNITFQVLKPHLIALAIFIALPLAYLSPALSGKILRQDDIIQGESKSYEIVNFRKETGEEPLWLGTMFSGMPAFQINIKHYGNLIQHVNGFVRSNLPETAGLFFLMLVNCYLMLIVLGVNPWLAIIGAITFAFSSGNVISIDAGHNSKINALAYAPGVLAGVFAGYRRSLLTGFSITAVATTLQLGANHFQITYYLILIIVLFGLIEFYNKLKSKELPDFLKRSAVLLLAGVLALGPNLSRLWTTYEYSAETIRGGKSELTEPDKERNKGLDKDYAMRWSYGKLETLTLLIPNFMGGASTEALSKSSNLAKKGIPEKFLGQIPTYWGTQPFTSGPIYQGAALIFLFVLGLFLLKGPIRTWALITSIVVIMLSWGKNFEIVTNLFIDYVPMYNKFRAVSSIQVIAELAIPLLAILGLKEWFSKKISSEVKFDALKKSIYIVGGLALIFTLFGTSLFAFEGLRDESYDNLLAGLLDAIIADRKAVFFSDSLRTLIFVVLSGGVLWLVLKEKIKQNVAIIALAVLILVDLISVDKRYVNNEDFLNAREIDKPFVASEIDKEILKDTSHYRVANFAVDPMNDGSTSYFHNSIGGYHAAKIGRYQELFDFQIAKNNMEVLNMLNTKYFIIGTDKGEKKAQLNPEANGNAWFVKRIQVVNSANEAIFALDTLNTKTVAVLESVPDILNDYESLFNIDALSSIKLLNYDVASLTYLSKTVRDQFAVFSEIYYEDGWNAYVDGKLVPHYRVNYVLRGMIIPKGEHTIEFKFEPKVIQRGKIISLFC